MKKIGIAILILFVLGIVAMRIVQTRESDTDKSDSQQEKAIPVEVIPVTRGTIRSTLSFNGDIKGRDQVSVFSEVPGRLLRYTVVEGDPIKKDQVIAFIDRAVTGMEFEEAKVKSPIGGTVGRLYLDRGDAVLLQTPIALMVKMDTVLIRVDVVERELPFIRKGMKAEIQVDAYPEEVFIGKVKRISPVVDPVSRTAPVEISIPNPPSFPPFVKGESGGFPLLPGMYAEVILVLEEHEDALVIPFDVVVGVGAVHILPLQKKVTFVVEENRVVERELKLGIRDGERVEVLEGLREGDFLIVSGERIVKDGDLVEIK